MPTRLVLILTVGCWTASLPAQSVRIPLNSGSQPACSIVACAEPSDRLAELAVRALADPTKRWSGVDLPVVWLGREASAEQFSRATVGSAIVLADLAALQRVAPRLVSERSELLRVESFDEQAYVCLPLQRAEGPVLIIAGRTPRAAYNGAVHIGESVIDGPADQLFVELAETVRAPQLRRRPMYVLTIWAEEDEYSTEDWLKIFETFAREGVTHIYFWLSGHYPSKAFPQTCKLADRDWDSTTDSRIATIADQRRLIEGAHQLGMQFFLGGGMGGWCGTFMLTNREAGTMREGSSDESGQDVSEWALCPSNDRAREALVTYYSEMFDSLPQADGLYIESADEYGECACARCRVPVDGLGSRMFGQNQLSLVQRMMDEVWTRHPQARLCYTIGYGPHRKDPAYYEVVRQMSADPRIEWMEARDSWTFPGPGGEAMPVAWFSPHILRWDYFDQKPLELLVENTRRAASSGMAGYIATFSPGFASGSFYHDIPFPTDRLPYVMTHFIYREAAWQPAGVEAIKQRVGRRFFGQAATGDLTDGLWRLRALLRETAGRKLSPAQAQSLAEIEGLVAKASGADSPKLREGLGLMSRATEDIRRVCTVTASKPK